VVKRERAFLERNRRLSDDVYRRLLVDPQFWLEV
jgi:hypothetical protein